MKHLEDSKKHEEELEKRRKARNEEKMRQQGQNRGRFNRNSERRYIGKKDAENGEATAEVETKKEETTEAKEAL